VYNLSIHTTLEEFENAAKFLRLALPSTLIRHENGAFRKRSLNLRKLKTLALRFSVDGNILKIKPFENDEVFLIVAFSSSSGVVWMKDI